MHTFSLVKEEKECRLTVDLVAGNTLDVDDPLAAVDLDDLALTAGEGATDNADLVILADGEGADLSSYPSSYQSHKTKQHHTLKKEKKDPSISLQRNKIRS